MAGMLPSWFWYGLLLVVIAWMTVRYVMPSKDKEEAKTEETPKKKDKPAKGSDKAKEQSKSTSLSQSVKDWFYETTGMEKPKPKTDEPKKVDPESAEFDFERAPKFGLPKYTESDQLVFHRTYTLSYNEEAEQANWVAYKLTRADVSGTATRNNDQFTPDPKVKTGSAKLEDYRNSGYDRGHLLPSADRKGSEADQAETFYLSNVSPQVNAMNAGIWHQTEELVRDWARHYGKLYVVTGPSLKPMPLERIGGSRVAVPSFFYKVVLLANKKESKMIAFWIPNKGSRQPIANYVTTVDEVEELTGLDFFPQIPDKIERHIESHADILQWQH